MSDEIRRLLQEQARQKALLGPHVNLQQNLGPSGALRHALDADRTAKELMAVKDFRNRVLEDLIPKSVRDMPAKDLLATTYGAMSSAKDAADEIERQRALLQLEEARRLGLLDSTEEIQRSLSKAMAASKTFEDQFRLPPESELLRLARESLAATDLARRYFTGQERLQEAMARMHSPWIQVDHAQTSAKAFADLVGIGRGLALAAPYDAAFVDALRVSLGDWRDTLVQQPMDLVDPIARLGLYRTRGFDPGLTDFTSSAFRESLDITGLAITAPHAMPSSTSAATDNDAPTRDDCDAALKAFGALRSFEIAVRKFIVQRLQAAFGANWMKRGLPADVLANCEERKKRGQAVGDEDLPLMDYADFTDYIKVIDRSDNWRLVFQAVFSRREDVKESFQRLGPVRIATMHSRMVLKEDQLMLGLETKRVLKAIDAAPAQATIP